VDLLTLAQLQNTAGVMIDDDNEPVPERPMPNIPAGIIQFDKWGHSGICNWHQAGVRKVVQAQFYKRTHPIYSPAA